MKQNDKVIYTAQAYANAETLGLVDGTTLFVPNMIVGECAVVKVNHVKNNIAHGCVEQLQQQSPRRQVPPCPHFGKCGGCSLMHMNYAEQLLFKQNKVSQNLKKLGSLQVDVLPCCPSPQTLGYRNKLSLPVRGKVGAAKIGMYQKNSHDLVSVEECLLGGDWSRVLVRIFKDYLNQNKIAPYNEKNFGGLVRHLVARYVDGQLLVTVVSNGKFTADLRPLVEKLKKHFPAFGLFVNQNTHKNNVILGEKTTHVFGLQHIEGQHLGVKFRLRPDSFFQVNDGVKNAIYQKAKQLLDISQTQVLVDCFSGVGMLTTVLASPNYQTFAVEIVPDAVKDANDIVLLNHTPNVTNICGDANIELPRLAHEHSGKTISLVVDPPRKGLGETICNTILQSDFNNIVYVSCDSATLARDLKTLSSAYDIDYVQPWDMFPNTAEVETVVHLRRR